MKSFYFVGLPIAAVSLVQAAGTAHTASCLTDSETSDLIAGFTTIISQTPVNQTLAAEILAVDFTSISDSVNYVEQIPLNTTATHSRAELIEQEGKLPFAISVKDLFVSHNCETITWYFEFATRPLPTRGIAILFVDLKTRLIDKAYRETNNAVTLALQGNPECKSNFTVSVGNQGPVPGEANCRSTRT